MGSLDAICKALSLSLLDSVWQMGFCWILFLLLTRLLLPRTAFAAGFIFSLLGVIAWGLSFYHYLYPAATSTQGAGIVIFLNRWWTFQHPIIFRFFSTLYLAGLSLVSFQFIVHYHRVHQIVLAPTTPAPDSLINYVENQALKLGIKRSILIKISELTRVPFTYGFWKPVILFPLAALNHLDPQETEAILLHELEHIRRKDYLLNYWIIFIDLLFFFNPFSRAITAGLRQAREYSCDDKVLQNHYSAWLYASALFKLAENEKKPAPVWLLGALSKSSLLLQQRIERFIRPSANRVVTLSFLQWLLVVGLLSGSYFLQPDPTNYNLAATFEARRMDTRESTIPAVSVANPTILNKKVKHSPVPIKTEERQKPGKVTLQSDKEVVLASEFVTPTTPQIKIRPIFTTVSVWEKRDLTYTETILSPTQTSQQQKAESWNLPYVPRNSFYRGVDVKAGFASGTHQVSLQKWKALCLRLMLLWEQTPNYSPLSADGDSIYNKIEEKLQEQRRQEAQQKKETKKIVSL